MTNKPTDAQVNRVQAEAKRELAAIATANAVHAAEIERKCREGVSRPELAEGLINIKKNKPPQVDPDLLARHENIYALAESIVARWYGSAGRKFRALHFLYGADELIRHIVKKALDAYPSGIDAKPDELIAISTTRPGDYWKINVLDDLHMVMDLMSLDFACDMDLMKNTDLAPCLEGPIAKLCENAKKEDARGVIGKDGLPNPTQREYIPQYFASVPFAIGNVIVILRICTGCYGAWIYRNQIDTKKLGEIEPVSDGFGQVGGGPITRDEYIWKPDTDDDSNT